MKTVLVYAGILFLLATWSTSMVGMAIFIFQGERFTQTEGDLLELRIAALEKVQTAPLPVMAWVKPKGPVIQKGTVVTGNFTALKQRPCDRVPDSEIGYFKSAAGITYEAGFQYIKDKTPNSTFAHNSIFNVGGIEWSGVKDARHVGYAMNHDCQGAIERSEFWFSIDEAVK